MEYQHVLHETVMDPVDYPTNEGNISPINFPTTFKNNKENNTLYATSQKLNSHAEDHRITRCQNSE